MTTVASYKNKKNGKVVRIMRVVKEGTKRVFFFPQTVDGKRLNSTLFARQYDAVSLGKIYLNN
jgi:hypothetical protein